MFYQLKFKLSSNILKVAQVYGPNRDKETTPTCMYEDIVSNCFDVCLSNNLEESRKFIKKFMINNVDSIILTKTNGESGKEDIVWTKTTNDFLSGR